ncbi:hypothetical protein BT96DRAFT_945426 [Gymnopus androsaceus JB14]|uniref:Uncharacterized protein n=1 Tax=Gymnopus androsaceus JB14 TaxID=1447944 RepID=A0A6A4GZY7_9AGAR|nr:hypothetical protein BT96DRAFT_945426 [Gymnopus androsaceus JB14]
MVKAIPDVSYAVHLDEQLKKLLFVDNSFQQPCWCLTTYQKIICYTWYHLPFLHNGASVFKHPINFAVLSPVKHEHVLPEKVDNVVHLDRHEPGPADDQGSVANNKPNDTQHETVVTKLNRALEIFFWQREQAEVKMKCSKSQTKGKEKGKEKGEDTPEDNIDKMSGQAGKEDKEIEKNQGRLLKEVKAQVLALSFTVHLNGLNMKPEERQSNKDFQEEICALDIKKCNNNNDSKDFEGAIEWYKKTIAKQAIVS